VFFIFHFRVFPDEVDGIGQKQNVSDIQATTVALISTTTTSMTTTSTSATTTTTAIAARTTTPLVHELSQGILKGSER
jgi:hypothetical protein